MTKHTPGPWSAEPYQNRIRVWRDNKPPRFAIADICTLQTITEPAPGKRTKANARLIAAAPELLAALKDLRAITNSALPHISKEWCRMGAPDGNHMEMSVAMSNAAEAIAKAEGTDQ